MTTDVPEPPAPVADPGRHKDRRLTWVAAIVSGLLAGALTAGASLVVSERQIESEAVQAQAEFLRAQRQVAYADLVNHSEVAAREYISYIRSPTEEQVKDVRSRLDLLVSDVEVDVSRIRLIGSREVAEQALAYFRKWGEAKIGMGGLDLCVLSHHSQQQPVFSCNAQLDNMGQVAEELDHLQDRFIKAARIDLGAD